jgi:hypothetical protein
MNRVPILVNDYERAVDAQLIAVYRGRGRRVHCKPRLADVLPVNDGQLSNADVSYALRAHFDFVVTDREGLAEIAVEFDGPHHRHDPAQRLRDERKSRICREYMLPLLRVGAAALRPADHRTLLEWLLQVCCAHEVLRREWREVWEVEERGEDWLDDLPEVELDDFDYREFWAVADDDVPGRIICAPLDAFHEARERIGRAHMLEHGRCEGWFSGYRGPTVGHVGLEVGESAWLLGTGRVDLRGVYPWISGLLPPRVAQDIALLDLHRQLDHWERHHRRAMSWEGVQAAVAGCEELLLARLNMPSRFDMAEYVFSRMRRRGVVDPDDPLVRARVFMSLEPDERALDYWDGVD